MTGKEADKIIKNYKPHEGFFDLSNKPKTLNKIEYAKILNMQNAFAEINKRIDYYKSNDPYRFHQIQELSAKLQQAIFLHWIFY